MMLVQNLHLCENTNKWKEFLRGGGGVKSVTSTVLAVWCKDLA